MPRRITGGYVTCLRLPNFTYGGTSHIPRMLGNILLNRKKAIDNIKEVKTYV